MLLHNTVRCGGPRSTCSVESVCRAASFTPRTFRTSVGLAANLKARSKRSTARVGNRRVWLLGALRAHTKSAIQTRFTVGNAKGA
jgi:hypothetical protein